MTNSNDALRLALSAIKVIAATVKTPDAPRALARIMAISRWAGIEAPYSELQNDERVVLLASNATRDEGKAMLTPSPVAGGDLREALSDIKLACEEAAYSCGVCKVDCGPVKAINEIHQTSTAALSQPAAPVEAGLLDRAELAWQRFFYPAADCFTGPIGDKLPSVDLEVADCLRLVLAAIGRNVVTPDHDVPALMAEEPSREGQIKTVAEKLAAFTGAPYEDWRHFTVEAGDIIDRLSALAHPPEPAASTVAQGEG